MTDQRLSRYAEAMCGVAHFDGWTPPVALSGSDDPRYRVAACFQCQTAARACVEVEDQRTADLRAKVARVDALFNGGPDTSCRTVWQDGVECVSVPLLDLRAALDEPEEDR